MSLIIRCDTPGCDAEETLSPFYWPPAPDAEVESAGWTVKQEPTIAFVMTLDQPVNARRFYCPDCKPDEPVKDGVQP